MIRHFLYTDSMDEKMACLKKINFWPMQFMKINISTIAAFMGKSICLQDSLKHGFPQMYGLNGKTPMDYAKIVNDYPTIQVLMNDYKTGNNVFIHPNDLNYMIINFKPNFRDVIDRCFKKHARFQMDIRYYNVEGIFGKLPSNEVLIQTDH